MAEKHLRQLAGSRRVWRDLLFLGAKNLYNLSIRGSSYWSKSLPPSGGRHVE